MLGQLCVPCRLSLLAAGLLCVAAGQDLPTIREIDVTLTEGTSMSAVMSPDRRWIAIDLVGRLWILPSRGGEAKPITPMLLEARQPTWSPDSDSLAFQGYDDGAWHIYVVPREGGEPRALTSGEFDDREPSWAHRGTRIAFSSDRAGAIITCWEVDAASGEVRQLSRRDGWMPSWSPNDQEITIVSDDRVDRDGDPVPETAQRPGLWGVGVDRDRLLLDSSARLRSGQPAPLPTGAAWNRDGTLVAYTSAGALHIGGEAVSRDEDVFPFRPQWISQTEVLYTADGRIKRRALGLPPAVVPFTARVTLQRAAFTIANRPLEPTGSQPLKGIVSPAVAPDGREVAFAALGDIWVAPLGGKPIRITDDEAVDLDPAWSPDGTRIAYASDRGGHMNIWVHDLTANSDMQFSNGRSFETAPAWSPDGSEMIYRSGRGLGIGQVARKADDCRASLANPPTPQEFGKPIFGPRCKSIAVGALFPYSNRYREGLNQLLVWSTELHSWSSSLLFPRHNAGNRDDNGPVWSPNGAQMAFVSEGVLWTVPVDEQGAATGRPFAVSDDQPDSPSWQGDSRHIVYQTPEGLRRVLADGGVPERVPLDMKWTPAAPPPRTVVHAGLIFDGVFDGPRGPVDIVIERGVIRDISGHRNELHQGLVLDAANELVMPGLIEMHAHLSPEYGRNFGRVWLAYGITSVRLPAVNPYAGIEQRESFEAGRRAGPRLFIAGDPFDGVRGYYPGGVSVTSEAQLDRELDRASKLGVDFFKTYVRLPDRLQKRIGDYAHAQGKPVTSHELYPAVAFGIDGVEHLRGTSRRGYSPKLSGANRAYQDVVELLAKSGITITPTIGIAGAFNVQMTGDRSLLYDQRLGLFPLPIVSRLTDLATASPDPALDARIKPYEATLKAIAAAGGRIIAGTDAPIDPYGLGLHADLAAYVHAGLTPFQALQTATVNAAQALGLQDQLGTIEVGKLADLTFLGSNPLDDIHNTRDVRRVMKGGRLYTVADLLRR